MSTKYIAQNLRYLCERRQSVSLVCRQLGFNRQQFGRYLVGDNRPSIYNLTRICQYFNITIDDIVLPPAKFQLRLAQSSTDLPSSPLPADLVNELLKISNASSGTLDNYVGHYFRYHYAFAFPGYIFRSFLAVQKRGKYYYTKHIERIPRNNAPTGTPLIIKYNGIMLEANSRFFLIERETLSQHVITETIYAPLHRTGGYLTGIGCSLSSSIDNHPTAARSVLEFIGAKTDLRKALKSCGIFRPDSNAINPYIVSMVDNQNKRKDFTIKAHYG